MSSSFDVLVVLRKTAEVGGHRADVVLNQAYATRGPHSFDPQGVYGANTSVDAEALLESLAISHPLVDGGKRITVAVADGCAAMAGT